MNVVMIVLCLISAYVLFVSVSYLLARMIFPKIEVEDFEVKSKVERLRQRRLAKVMR